MTAPKSANKNPLTVSHLGKYDTERGPITESLDILAALKAAQSRFRKRILRHSILQNKPELYHDLSRCGQDVFFKHYPETGERSFAGGFTCKRHWICPACAFRRAYVTALHSARRISELIADRGYVPAFIVQKAAPGPDFAERFRSLKKFCRKTARMRISVAPFIKGAFGCYDFQNQNGLWRLSFAELVLIDPQASPSPSPRAMTSEDVFKMVFEMCLGSVLMLDPSRQMEAVQGLQGTYPFFFTGCLTGLAHSSGNDSSDPPADHLTGQQHHGEQYHWNSRQKCYELVKVVHGEEIEFPLASFSPPGRRRRCLSKRMRIAAERRAKSAAKEVRV